MAHLSFQFHAGIARRAQDAAMAKVRKLAGVQYLDRIDPESEDPVISRMWHATVSDAEQLESVKSQLARIPGVESIEEPPQRQLVW